MGLKIAATGDVSLDLYATLQQVTANGALGDIWNATTSAWASSVPNANREIALTEGTSINVGSYSAGTGTLSTYSGYVRIRIHDRNLASVLGVADVRVVAGDQLADTVTSDLMAVNADALAAKTAAETTVSRLTSTRAGYLDNLSAGAVSTAAALASTTTTVNTGAADALAAKNNSATASTEATAAKVAAQSADGKLPAGTTTALNRIDATISSRSSHTAADVRSALASNPVPASNMRGTDNALLAASYTAPDNTGIGAASTNALAAKTASETTVARLTATRAGYLDNLSAGPVATQAQVSAITNSTRSKFVAPAEVQIPTSGSTTVLVTLVLFDSDGNLDNPDGAPTFSAKNQAGTDRSANLGTASHPSVGLYEIIYTVSSAHAAELINLRASWTESGVPSLDIVTMSVSSLVSGGGFNTTDRTNLTSVANKLPSRAYLAGTDASDGDINLDNLTGDRTSFMANVSALATSAQITTLSTHGDAAWATATGFVLSTDTRLNRLDVAVSSRSTFTPTGTLAYATDIAALQAHGDLVWDTAVGFLTSSDSRLNHLDADISSRSAFNAASDTVTLTSGHGLATQTTALAIKAKTDTIPTQPAETADIPTASEIAVAVDAVVTASHGTGSYITQGGDATLAKQDQILAQIAALTPTPVSPLDVSDSRTWELRPTGEGAVAQNIITISTTESVTLAVNFSSELNPDASLTTVVSVTVTDGLSLTTTALLPNGRRTHAHFNVSGATAGVRRLAVKVNTSDGDVIVGKVTLEVV